MRRWKGAWENKDRKCDICAWESHPSSQDCRGTLPSLIPSSTSVKASPSCQHTQGGPWPAPSEVSQLRRSPAVPRQDWPGIANASLLAGHPCNASIRIYCVTRFLCSQFDVPPPAAYLSPSPGRGCVPLECESILILKKKKTGPSVLYITIWHAKQSSFSDDSQLSQ